MLDLTINISKVENSCVFKNITIDKLKRSFVKGRGAALKL